MCGLHFCWRINWTLTRRLLIIFTWRYWKEGDLYEVCSRSLMDVLQEHCVTSCEELPRSVEPFRMFPFASLLGMYLGYFSSLLKQNIRTWSGEQNHLWRLRNKPFLNTFHEHHVIYKQFLPEGKTWNFVTGAGKFIEACFERGPQFREWGRILEIPSVWQYTSSFCHDNEVHAGKLWHVGNQPPTIFTCSCSMWLFFSWKWKPSLKEQDFRTSRTSIM